MKANVYSKTETRIISLLPNYCKWVGLSLMLLLGLFFLVAKFLIPEFVHNNEVVIFDVVGPRVFLLGFLIICLSRDKVEDELTLLVRLRALGFTFILVAGMVIVEPIANLICKDPNINVTATHFVLRMLIAYQIIFFIFKKVR
jgi:hypothetical protein